MFMTYKLVQALRLLTERQLSAYREGRVVLSQSHLHSGYQPSHHAFSDLLIPISAAV